MKLMEDVSERVDQVLDSKKSKPPWKSWGDDPLPLTLWQIWTALALVRQQERQELVAEIVQHRLNVDLDQLASAGTAHLNIPLQGVVSDSFCEWKYSFHGHGCCLTDPKIGECITVDFHGGTAAWIDARHFLKCLESLKTPPFVEARFKALHSSFESLQLSIDGLVENGVAERFGDRPIICLNFEYEWLYDVLQNLEAKWQDKTIRRAVAAAVGDWFLLEELVSSKSASYSAIRENAASCRAKPSNRIVRPVAEP